MNVPDTTAAVATTFTAEFDGYLTSIEEFTMHRCGSDWQPNPETTRSATIAIRAGQDSAILHLPWDGPIPVENQRVRVTVDVISEPFAD